MARNWSEWESLGKPAQVKLAEPFVQRNQDGRLEVFAVGGGKFFNIWQLSANNGWKNDGWNEKGKPSAEVNITSLVVGRNLDGRLEVFAAGNDNAIWQNWQTVPNGGWHGWKTLGRPNGQTALSNKLTVGQNQDSRQELFVVGEDGNLWQIWQTFPNAGWSDWKSLGAPPGKIRASDRPTVAQNQDGRQEIFLIGEDDAVYQIWQTAPNGGWSQWKSLGKPPDATLSNPFVQRNQDGRLEVFAPGGGVFFNIWQLAPNSGWKSDGWNKKSQPSNDVEVVSLVVSRNQDGRIEVFALGSDSALWHNWQTVPNGGWHGWKSLEAPSGTKLRLSDRPTVERNQNGKLEVLVFAEDDNLWHTRQN